MIVCLLKENCLNILEKFQVRIQKNGNYNLPMKLPIKQIPILMSLYPGECAPVLFHPLPS